MSEIKVTVSYEKPTTSKFDALMKEYEAAKKYADETVSYYKPLADAAEEAKFNAIMEQLETIKEYARKIYELNKQKAIPITASIYADERGRHASGTYEFIVRYYPEQQNYYVIWINSLFNLENIKKEPWKFCEIGNNILGMWDEWKVYEKLENDACKQIKSLINAQNRRAEKHIDRLVNITKGGN